MLKIRLQRVGRKHDPSFRVVVSDARYAAKSGKALEVLGTYNARFGTPTFKPERIKEWIGKGAQLSDTVHNLLIDAKIIEGKKINALPKKTPIKKEVPAEAAPVVVTSDTMTSSMEEASNEETSSVDDGSSTTEVSVG
ncbi:MAG: 30S ribosomal protein S16 [Candidatus Yonathbacteria bacterium]|nr:30S ribosomal protein S16 [Candidatus Yonathbacteria bacterium]NTW47786.1 30S ribosomal protein S16 [Candidatus Yonathbacteria bacterium]